MRSNVYEGSANLREFYWNYPYKVHVFKERWPYVPKSMDMSGHPFALTYKEYHSMAVLYFYLMLRMLMNGMTHRFTAGLGEFKLVRQKVMKTQRMRQYSSFMSASKESRKARVKGVSISGYKFRLKWDKRGWNLDYGDMWSVRISKKLWKQMSALYRKNPSDIFKIEEINRQRR